MRSQKVRREGGAYLTVRSSAVTHSLKSSKLSFPYISPSSPHLLCTLQIPVCCCHDNLPVRLLLGCYPLQVWREKKKKEAGGRQEVEAEGGWGREGGRENRNFTELIGRGYKKKTPEAQG